VSVTLAKFTTPGIPLSGSASPSSTRTTVAVSWWRSARCQTGPERLIEQIDCIRTAGTGQSVIASHDPTAISPGESQEISIRYLAGRLRLPELQHDRRRHGVGPEQVSRTGDPELEQSVSCDPRSPAADRQLSTDTNHTELRERAGGPSLVRADANNPPSGASVVLVRRDQQGHEHIDVEQSGHYDCKSL
jgi:hypothetical protein